MLDAGADLVQYWQREVRKMDFHKLWLKIFHWASGSIIAAGGFAIAAALSPRF